MLLRPERIRLDVELEHLARQRYGDAGIGDVDDAADASFDRCAAQDRIGLLPEYPNFFK